MRRAIAAAVLLAATACVDDTGSTLTILGVPVADESTCTFSPDQNVQSFEGFYDPGEGANFFLALQVRNNLMTVDEDPADGVNGENIRPDTNDVDVHGFDVCWYLADDAPSSSYGAQKDGYPSAIKCDNLPPEQRRFAPAAAVIAPRSTGVVGAEALTVEGLQAQGIYGSGFNPLSIPQVGEINNNTQDLVDLNLDGIYDPDEKVWNPAPNTTAIGVWGDYFTVPSNRVIVQARAVGQTAVGKDVESDWFAYPIMVGPHAVLASCGLLVNSVCAGGSYAFQGLTPDLSGSCLPYQGGPIECVPFDACP